MYPIYPSFLEKDQLDPYAYYAYYDDYGNRFLIMDLRELSVIEKLLTIRFLIINR
jgi:hypothetical protein